MTNYTPDYTADDISGAVISGLGQAVIEGTGFITLFLVLVVLALGVVLWRKIVRG
jgi:hypothetical protein